jgi:uncharacterized protein YeaO (DUF488 family)
MKVVVKRVYEPAQRADGARVLVDRLWPRGISKEKAALTSWMKPLAPSDVLRQWFHAHRAHWQAFRRYYLKELAQHGAEAELGKLYDLAHRRKQVTLLFASKDEDRNNAVVLKELIEGMKKPPTGTGPSGARVVRRRVAARPA